MRNLRGTRNKHKIRQKLIQYIEENIRSYLILLIVFFIGIILGTIFINNSKENQVIQITTYINNFINSMKNNYQISTNILLIDSIINNVSTAILLWFLGSTVIGVPLIYLVIGYKGYCIGFTISAIIATIGAGKGILFIIGTMLLQNIIYIPCILTLATSGIKLYKLIIEDRRRENVKLQILKHTIFSIFILLVLIISSFVETFISGNLITVLIKYC